MKCCYDYYSEAKNAKHCGVGVDSPGRGASIAIAGLYDASALGARHEFGNADAEQITTRKTTSDDEAHTGLKYMIYTHIYMSSFNKSLFYTPPHNTYGGCK